MNEASNPSRGELTDTHRRNLQLTSIAVSLFTGRPYAEWELNVYVLPLVRMFTRLTRHTDIPSAAQLVDDLTQVISMNVSAFHGDVRRLLQSEFPEQVNAIVAVITGSLSRDPDILNDISTVVPPKSRYPALFSMFDAAHTVDSPAKLLIFGHFSEVLESDRIRESEKVIVVMDLAKSLRVNERTENDEAAPSIPRQIS